MRAAIKLHVRIPRDRRLQLPEDLPEGQAEIIVLYPESGTPEAGVSERGPRKALRASRSPGDAPGPVANRVDYFARLVARQPHPLSAEASRALDEANRGDR